MQHFIFVHGKYKNKAPHREEPCIWSIEFLIFYSLSLCYILDIADKLANVHVYVFQHWRNEGHRLQSWFFGNYLTSWASY